MKKTPMRLTWLQNANNCEMINVAGYDQPYFKQLDLFKINKSNHIIAKHELILDRLLLLFLICKLNILIVMGSHFSLESKLIYIISIMDLSISIRILWINPLD